MIVFNFLSTIGATVKQHRHAAFSDAAGAVQKSPRRRRGPDLEEYCMGMLRTFVHRFVRDERGAALAEYAAIFLVLAVAGTAILINVGGELAAAGTAIQGWINTEVTTQF
jgi:Flp pilus assembly pilin Flp